MAKSRIHSLLFDIHLYLNLTLGLVLLLLGLTGTILCFHNEIDTALNPDFRAAVATPEELSLDNIIRSARVRTGRLPDSIAFPADSAGPATLTLYTPGDDGETIRRVLSADPETGEILAERVWGQYFTSFVYELHKSLFLGSTGLLVVGIVGFSALLTIATGIYLWWPRRGPWKRGFVIRRSRRLLPFSLDFHKVAGFYSAVVLGAVAVSGMYFCFYPQFTAAVEAVAPTSSEPRMRPVQQGFGRSVGADEALAVARAVIGEGSLTRVAPPKESADPYTFTFYQEGEVGSGYGRSRVWIDPATGGVLGRHTYEEFKAGDKILAWQMGLHNGRAFGWPGRLLVSVLGLVIALLFVSGVYLWWKRRRLR